MTNVEAISDLLKPFDAQLMRMFPVSSRINHVQNDDADCSKSVTVGDPPQAHLFA
jgi:putative SOS response-associated peptidase YedK